MKVKLTLDESGEAQRLVRQVSRTISDDTDPFYMAELNIFRVGTLGPITSQSLPFFLRSFPMAIPIERFQNHMNSKVPGSDPAHYWQLIEHQKIYEDLLEGWLCKYQNSVRKYYTQSGFRPFLNSLYSLLRGPILFLRSFDQLFIAPDYYCSNINALILTRDRLPEKVNRAALFSFFISD